MFPFKVFGSPPFPLHTAITAKSRFSKLYHRLLKDADAALESRIESVVEKTSWPSFASLNVSAHDYVSRAPYFWPDERNPGGPYIRRDGEKNPESVLNTDLKVWERACKHIYSLALGFYVSRDDAYARRCIETITAWVVAEETRMNPHFTYAQSVVGVNDGRPFGILEGH